MVGRDLSCSRGADSRVNPAQASNHLPDAGDDPPLPPADVAQWTLPLLTMPPMTMYRGHAARHAAAHFNQHNGRWTSPDGSFGTLYVAEQVECAFIEAFAHHVAITAGRPWMLSERLRTACLCELKSMVPLRVVDLTHGAALTSLAADVRVTHGPHALSRQWAQALHAHPAAPDGIRYRSRRAPEQACLALFDRVAGAIQTDCTTNLLQDAARLGAMLDALGIMLER